MPLLHEYALHDFYTQRANVKRLIMSISNIKMTDIHNGRIVEPPKVELIDPLEHFAHVYENMVGLLKGMVHTNAHSHHYKYALQGQARENSMGAIREILGGDMN